jgi:hypothetical protein
MRREEFALTWARCDEETVGEALGRPGKSIPVIGPPQEPNGEGIAFLPGTTGYLTLSEGAGPVIYFFASECPLAPGFSVSLTNKSAYAGATVQFQSMATGYPAPSYTWRFNGELLSGQNGPALLLPQVTAAQAGTYEVTAANAHGSVASSATLEVRAKPDLRITEVQSSTAPSPNVPNADWWELTSFESQPANLTGWRFNDNSGGLTDPFVFGSVTISPRESIIFVEELTPAEFRNWWGDTNVPANAQIVTYQGSGLSLSADSDGIRLWTPAATSEADVAASVDFGAAVNGVSFNYNPESNTFGELSQVGRNGVVQAALSNDIGSPGRILPTATRPQLRATLVNNSVRIAFNAEVGRQYALEVSENLGTGWRAAGPSILATNNSELFFETDWTPVAQMYRVAVR